MDDPSRRDAAVISRRDAIVGALALAAGTLIASTPETARALDGDPILIGRSQASTSMTWIFRTDTGTVEGNTYTEALLNSVVGPGSYGVYGRAVDNAGPSAGGVLGEGTIAGQTGVYALNGVAGGIGLKASAPNGTALQVDGPATFSRSGRGSIARGSSSTTVAGLTNIGTNALILVTLQGSAGSGVVLRYAKRLASTKFQVVLNKPATTKVYFAWMILN